MMAIQWWVLIFLIWVVAIGESNYMVYNTTSGIVPGKLNVHLVAHTHDDVGWLKTVDQYYVGSNNSIQVACVQNVLDSIVPALLADKNRKFIYVEQAFFQRWWRTQSEAVQEIVRQLVSSGQLELINGGYCMHDEAATHYIDMIDQTTLGHRFIKREFNVTPRIGWQIDPFGHSAVQAYLLGAEVGFDSLFFGRIDYQDRAKRRDDKALEVVWRGSKSLGSSAQIFADAFPNGNYEPPTSNFYFEITDTSDVVQDDMDLFDYNVPERVNEFISAALSQANVTRTNHIMWTMGTDFRYQYAHTWFRQMDKFIHYVNKDGRVNALYSTPSIYTDAKHATRESWPLKTDDYFPYADRVNAYWTGYFTSRPALKGYVRTLSAYYLAARQLEFFSGRRKAGPTTDSLADALAITQHHDGVSGTSQQHVANDYAKRLSIGYDEAAQTVETSLTNLVESSSSKSSSRSSTKFQQCPLLNISYCPASEVELSDKKSLVVVVYNSLGWKREDVIRIPVIDDKVTVKDSGGKVIDYQLLPIQNVSLERRNHYSKAYLGRSPNATPKYWLAFSASAPPLGFNTYFISRVQRPAAQAKSHVLHSSGLGKGGTVGVGLGATKLVYSGDGGKLRYINSRTKINATIEQSYSYYVGDDGSGSKIVNDASGAYLFRPNGSFPLKSKRKASFTVLRGPLLDEVHQKTNSWINQIARVYKGKEHVEFEFNIGPIPIGDGFGKEIVTKITSDIRNKKTFYTDSNGRDFIERIRNYRKDWNLEVNQPIAGNYYPINLGMFIKDDNKELSVLVDRSVGGSSIVDGQVEIMLHRRLLFDDGRGVAEALNETVCVLDKCTGLTIVGKYYLRLDPLGEGAKWRRSFGQEIYTPFLLAFTQQDESSWKNSRVLSYSGIDPSYVLPDNVAIITLQELDDAKALIRLAHLYEVGEDKDLAVMATVELKKLFADKKIKEITETSLSANQGRAEMEKKRLVWKVEGSSSSSSSSSSSEEEEDSKAVRGGPVDLTTLEVELAPMEIRTFVLNLD